MSRNYDPYDVFSFEGRIRRRDWWLTCLLVNFTATASASITGILFPDLALIFWIALNAIATWVVLAASVKRAHDRNDSGALPIISCTLGWLLAAAVILGASTSGPTSTSAVLSWFLMALFFVNGLIGVWLLISLGFLDGTPDTNQYGLSPKGVRAQNYRSPRAD